MTIAALAAAVGALGLVCGTAIAVRWIDRCDCRFANETDSEED